MAGALQTSVTLQKTNMKLEHGPLEEEIVFSETVVFRFRVPLNKPNMLDSSPNGPTLLRKTYGLDAPITKTQCNMNWLKSW